MTTMSPMFRRKSDRVSFFIFVASLLAVCFAAATFVVLCR